MSPRARVAGVGGVFFKSRDPVALAAWYREQLGIDIAEGQTYGVFSVGGDGRDATGSPAEMAWLTFPADTKYFGERNAGWMINYRVADLDAMLAQLRAAGGWVSDKIDESEFGRFSWAEDPDGNRFELWQPPRGE